MVSEARLEVTQNEGKAALALDSEIAQKLALLDKQVEVDSSNRHFLADLSQLLKHSRLPVVLPQFGAPTNMWYVLTTPSSFSHQAGLEILTAG